MYRWYGLAEVPSDWVNMVQIAPGGYHNLGLRADGRVLAFGLNDSGQCNVPPNLQNVLALAAGTDHSLALVARPYAYDPSGNTRYETCAPENQQYCLADSDCGSGQRCDTSVCYQPNCPPDADCANVCEGVCVPDAACSNVDCGMGYHCEETCYPCDPANGMTCDNTCYPSCVPDQTCATVDCARRYGLE